MSRSDINYLNEGHTIYSYMIPTVLVIIMYIFYMHYKPGKFKSYKTYIYFSIIGIVLYKLGTGHIDPIHAELINKFNEQMDKKEMIDRVEYILHSDRGKEMQLVRHLYLQKKKNKLGSIFAKITDVNKNLEKLMFKYLKKREK